jgi:hypothetical protein
MSEDEIIDLVDQICDLMSEFGAETSDWPMLSKRVQVELDAREEVIS